MDNPLRCSAFRACVRAACIVLAWTNARVSGQPEIFELGFRDSYTTVNAISADGRTAVGFSMNTAYRWTVGTGTEDIGTSWPSPSSSAAYDVSADGNVIVGTVNDAQNHVSIFRWTESQGAEIVVSDARFGPGLRVKLSSDGSTLFGYRINPSPFAFRWNATDGYRDLGFMAGGERAECTAMDATGANIFGWSDSNFGRIAFYWSRARGMRGMGFLPGNSTSMATDASADGVVAVGTSGNGAFIWSLARGLRSIGPSPSGEQMTAEFVNNDGTVIFGNYNCGTRRCVYRWTEATGAQPLSTNLGPYSYVSGISADGSAMVGGVGSGVIGFPAITSIWTQALERPVSLLSHLTLQGAIVPYDLYIPSGISADGSSVIGLSGSVSMNTYIVRGLPSPLRVCDTIDFNSDHVFPDARDIADFLSVLSGGPCSNEPLCGGGSNDIDFNNDGVSPDSADIEALLRVFAGSVC